MNYIKVNLSTVCEPHRTLPMDSFTPDPFSLAPNSCMVLRWFYFLVSHSTWILCLFNVSSNKSDVFLVTGEAQRNPKATQSSPLISGKRNPSKLVKEKRETKWREIDNFIVPKSRQHSWALHGPATRTGWPGREVTFSSRHPGAVHVAAPMGVAICLQGMCRVSCFFIYVYLLHFSLPAGENNCSFAGQIGNKTQPWPMRDLGAQFQTGTRGSWVDLPQIQPESLQLFSFWSISYSWNFALFQSCNPTWMEWGQGREMAPSEKSPQNLPCHGWD